MTRSSAGILLIAALILTSFGVWWVSPPKGITTGEKVPLVRDLGSIRLRLQSGDAFDGGKVKPGSRVLFRVPFINEGRQPIILSRFRLCETCCQGGKLLNSTGVVEPNGSGELQIEVTVGERPGRATVQAVVEYLPDGPSSELQPLPSLPIHLSYEPKSHGLCEWEFPEVDLGEVAVTRGCKCELHFTEQLYEIGDPTLELTCEAKGVEVRVVSESDGHGLYDIRAHHYTILCDISPEILGLGRQQAILLAKSPLGFRKMRVRWTALPEYRFLPNPCVLFHSAEQSQTHWLNLRNLVNEQFVIEEVVCDIPGVEVEHQREPAIQQRVVLQGQRAL